MVCRLKIGICSGTEVAGITAEAEKLKFKRDPCQHQHQHITEYQPTDHHNNNK